MPLADRPNDAIRDFLGGSSPKPVKQKKKVRGEKTYLLRLPAEDMARAKIAATRHGETMKEFFARVIAQACRDEQ